MSKAIVVSYDLTRIAFIIEGFNDPSKYGLDGLMEVIKEKIILFYKRLLNEDVSVEKYGNIFKITTKTDTFMLTWSWYTSIVK